VRDENAGGAILPLIKMRAVAPGSAQVRQLVMRAVVFFESNREAAWRCLRDAWTLLGEDSEAIGIIAPPSQSILRPGGLAVPPPIAYVAARRAERAKLMMTSTPERLTDIALACGFSDQPHLNRSFRRVVGTSPGHWRRTSIRN
jgi:AraC-like DNA-binding protein